MLKRIERAARRLIIGMMRLIPRRRGALDPEGFDPGGLGAPRILLVRPDRIGDALVSTPIVALLRERFPDAVIDMLLGAKNKSVAPLIGGIDQVFVLPASPIGMVGTIRRLRARRYDVAINLLAKDSASGALVTSASGAGMRIGFEGRTGSIYDVAVPHSPEPLHIVRATSLLLAPFGIEAIGAEPRRDAERLRVAIPGDAREAARRSIAALTGARSSPILLFHISGSGPEKYWGREKFIELARLVLAEGLSAMIASAPTDAQEAAAIASASGALLLPATNSFAAFAASLDNASMILTPDTSVVHLAAALGKPTVMLAGSPDVGSAWGPWGVPHRIIAGDGTLGSIEVRAVLDSIRSLGDATRPAHNTSSAS